MGEPHHPEFDFFDECGSPIEELMLDALLRQRDASRVPYGLDVGRLTIYSQEQIGPYRVDFLVNLRWEMSDVMWFSRHLVVECDGHDWHDRTKEQASSDRRRDRILQAQGYPVFRFTGRDIYRDADGCARECVALLSADLESKARRWEASQVA